MSDKSSAIIQEMSQMSLSQLANAYKIKEAAAEKEEARIRDIISGTAPSYPAIQLFNGLMYRYIDKNLIDSQNDYLKNCVFITSSLYGIIPAYGPIAEHRHDFHTKMSVDGQSLKAYWRHDYDDFVSKKGQIISLLSSEFEEVFSKKIRDQFITVKFMEEKDGQLKTHSTISKKARGAFLTAACQEQVQSVDKLKELTFSDFLFRPDLSTEHQLVYTKKV
ncbi:cytoplasmic iron level regulating protein YaaA (DUF328/UPF0246 family) [Streptococcus loxodontisalivarius]|uniref:UPF0246 protein JOC28_000250 n=2 Tax=Streptococcus loxodontisalivarius TaxID=1349415 RepID=A0ABS2PRF0_9STRE|nr:cytoplasmic iron level regulating protein YaaA (DUF328/UPF0246 family) [Streptococcus loxodontisalivarius]